MKRYTRCFLLTILAFSFQGIAWTNASDDKLADIILGFSNQDTARQYDARRELASYVADATAPDKVNGAENVTKALLGYLANSKVPHEAKKYIIRDLARVGTGTAVAPLGKIMLGKDSMLSESAREALEQIDDKKATEVLKKAVAGASDEASRQIYLRTLANRRDAGSVDYFIKGLNSGDTVLALESIYALTKMGDAQSLEKAYNSKPAAELKLELERSVVALEGTSNGTLVQIQKSGISSANRQAALVRLAASGHEQSTDLLKAAFLDADSDLRGTAMRAALSNGKQALVVNNVRNFSDDDWRIVLGGLKAFEGKGAEELAVKAVEEGSADVRAAGLRALGTYGSDKSIDLILEHFAGSDKELKLAASYAIERLPGTTLNTRLQKMLNSEDEAEAILAIEALAHRDLPNAKNRLFRFVNGDNPKLAREALGTLSVIADEEDLYRLLFLSRRSDESLSKLINGMLKKVASDIGSLELKAKVKQL